MDLLIKVAKKLAQMTDRQMVDGGWQEINQASEERRPPRLRAEVLAIVAILRQFCGPEDDRQRQHFQYTPLVLPTFVRDLAGEVERRAEGWSATLTAFMGEERPKAKWWNFLKWAA